ncbi:MAG: Uma2 family endonuclease, partial [Planctomycetota bacterium]
PFRIETNAYGQILMTPPASGGHSRRQGEIGFRLRQLLGGRALPECPVSTLDGVKAVDVGWYSDKRFAEVDGQSVFEIAPEICVEVLSPSNTDAEMRAKCRLYFEAGADEVWLCQLDGGIQFYQSSEPNLANTTSPRCPDFPTKV